MCLIVFKCHVKVLEAKGVLKITNDQKYVELPTSYEELDSSAKEVVDIIIGEKGAKIGLSNSDSSNSPVHSNNSTFNITM